MVQRSKIATGGGVRRDPLVRKPHG